VKDSRAGHSKLLVARGYKRSEAVCGGMQRLSAKQKSHRAASRKVNAKLNPRETMGAYISRFYHQAASIAGIR